MTDEQALRRILGTTGVTYRYVTSRSLRLERGELPVSVADRTTVLDPVTALGRQSISSPKYTEPLRDVPQTVTVVPQEIIQQQGATTLRDVLRNVSGLTVNAGEGGATPGDNFNVRGFSARSDVFVDGVRDVGGYSRETFNIEQVEVAKGPGSTYTGRGSTGGSINLVTKSPLPVRRYSGTAGVGTADFRRGTVDINQPLGDAGLSGAAVRLNAAWQDAGIEQLDRVERQSWGVAPSAALGLGGDTQLTLQYFHAEQDNVPSYGLASQDSLPRVDTHNFFGLSALDHERVKADEANGRVDHKVSENLSLRQQFTWRRSDVDRVVTSANAANGARTSRSHITHDENLTSQTVARGGLNTGAVRHDVVAGLDVAREHGTFAGYTFAGAAPVIPDLNDPDPDVPYTGTITRRRPTRDATANTAGVYAFETMKIGSNLELNAGGRWDYFRAEYQDSLGKPLDPAGTTTRAFTWRAGAVVKPVESGSIYGAYGTSFNPSGETLALDSRGNADLDPERSRSIELGTKWDFFRSRLLLSLAAFRTEKTNARIANPDDPSGPQILAGDQRVDGVELGVSGRVLPSWSLFGGYTYMDSEIVEGAAADVGKPIANTPRHSGSIWSSVSLPMGAEVGAGVRYMGERFVRGEFYNPSYTTVDAEAGYTVNGSLTLRLNLYNLTDETYYDSSRYWVPAAGRSARLTAAVNF
nr:TonB-dependent siderophore receptor [Longimicrobium terrae]